MTSITVAKKECIEQLPPEEEWLEYGGKEGNAVTV